MKRLLTNIQDPTRNSYDIVTRLGDPRVRHRVTTALEFCRLYLEDEPNTISHSDIQAVFGNRSSPLGQYLRTGLLTYERPHLKGVTAILYSLNTSFYQSLKSQVEGIDTSCEQPGLPQDFSPSLDFLSLSPPVGKKSETAFLGAVEVDRKSPGVSLYGGKKSELETLTFAYSDKSNRLWHPYQFISSAKKDEFWKPYLPFNYDVEACAPTVLLHLADKYQLPRVLSAAVREYIADRQELREYVADLTGLSFKSAKTLITSLFNGGRLAANWHCGVFREMNGDKTRMTELQRDHRVCRLRTSIKNIWSVIGTSTGIGATPSSKEKWALYFSWERQMLNAVTAELDRQGLKYFTEHDGFRTNTVADTDAIVRAVKSATGLSIRLDTK